MDTTSLHMDFSGALLTMVAFVLVAELAGYGLHRLMHSGCIPALSRAHLIHHLLLYGPQQPMRTVVYRDANCGRASIGNVGLEWLVPSAFILAFCWCAMWLLGIPIAYRCLAFLTLVEWPSFMFSYLHDRMHIQGFWMERAPLMSSWFCAARRLHDIHHHSIDERGRLDKNFGIGFYLFDRIFCTFAKHHHPFNWHRYRAAIERSKLEQDLLEEFLHFPSQFRIKNLP